MKIILLDENLPDPLKNDFSGSFEVVTVHDKGWQSKQNGELLKVIDEEEIDILMTADRNLEYQQNLQKYQLRLAVLEAVSKVAIAPFSTIIIWFFYFFREGCKATLPKKIEKHTLFGVG